MQGKEQKTLDKLNIENRRKKERRSEEIATIDDDRSTDTPRRLQDKIDHVLTTPPHAAVEEEVDDELMAIFFDSSTKNRDKLNAALSNKEWSEVRATVHTIKGSAASFGYPELSKMAETVQLAIDQERLDEVPALAMALVRSIGEIIP